MMNTGFQDLSKNTSPTPSPVIVHHGGKPDIFNVNAYSGKYLVLVLIHSAWEPCSSKEVLSFSKMLAEFENQNCNVVGISRDGPAVLIDWMKENDEFLFPIISDLNLAENDFGLTQRLGLTLSLGYPIHSSVVIDNQGIIRYISSNFPSHGDSAGEILRIVKALNIIVDKADGRKLTPANWEPEDHIIWNTRQGVDHYYSKAYPEDESNKSEQVSKRSVVKSIQESEVAKIEKSEPPEEKFSHLEKGKLSEMKVCDADSCRMDFMHSDYLHENWNESKQKN